MEGEVRLCGEKFITEVDGPRVLVCFVLRREVMSEVINTKGVEIMMESDWCKFEFIEKREIGKTNMSKKISFVFSKKSG